MKKLEDILTREMKAENDELKNNLKTNLSKEDWLLCLGAGVSQSCGLPGWSPLLSKMLARIMSQYPIEKAEKNNGISTLLQEAGYNEDYVENLVEAFDGGYSAVMNGMDSLEAAEYVKNIIETLLKNQEKNEEIPIEEKRDKYIARIIQECCQIEKLPLKYGEKGKDGKQCKKKTTLEAVVHLMSSSRTGIRTALTYNYDNLVEEGLRKYENVPGDRIRSLTPDERETILSRQIDESKSEYRIFHIHGRIPVIKGSPGTEAIQGKIILTETSYYEEEKNGYTLANVLQSYSMTHYNLLYVGFSGADYSFRRILRGLGKEDDKDKKKERYIFFCVDDVVNAVTEAYCKEEGKENEGEMSLFERVMITFLLDAKKQYWQKHGMTVIWSTLAELPWDLSGLVETES